MQVILHLIALEQLNEEPFVDTANLSNDFS